MTKIDLYCILPLLIPMITAFLVLIGDTLTKNPEQKKMLPFISLTGVIVTLLFLVHLWRIHYSIEFPLNGDSTLLFDPFSILFSGIGCIVVLLAILNSAGYTNRVRTDVGEYYALLLFSLCGIILLSAGTGFIMIFLGVELLSLTIYALTGFIRYKKRALEGAMKYFILGGFASAFLLFGIVILTGLTGSLSYTGPYIGNVLQIAAGYTKPELPILYFLGIGLVFAGVFFKLGIIPFHFWAPDAYEGASAPITGYMAAGVKIGMFAFLCKFIAGGLVSPDYMTSFAHTHIVPVLIAGVVLTVIFGNIIALAQNNIKRMLAYSSIAHAGYILIGVVAYFGMTHFGIEWRNDEMNGSIAFYLLSYGLTTAGAFGIISLLGKKYGDLEDISDYAGLAHKRPLLGISMTLFMFSFAGIPATSGFLAKFFIFKTAIDSEYYTLAILGIIGSIFSLYYYLRITVYMYMKQPREDTEFEENPSQWGARLVIFISAIGVLYLGIFPDTILTLTNFI